MNPEEKQAKIKASNLSMRLRAEAVVYDFETRDGRQIRGKIVSRKSSRLSIQTACEVVEVRRVDIVHTRRIA